MAPTIKLTHKGIKEVEDVKRHPERETTYFSPNVINYTIYGNVTNSPFQQGNVNSTQNNITLEQNLNLFRIIVALKNFLNSEQLKADQKENLESYKGF